MQPTIHNMYKKLLLSIIAVLTVYTASGQKQDGLDSILLYVNQLSGVLQKDSLLVDELRERMSSFKPEFLADKRFEKAMLRLKSTLKPDAYITIEYYFLSTATYGSKAGEYDYPIDYGLNFIDALKSYSSTHQRFILLKAMRDMRVPFRNGSRIYEGIEKYSTLASYYKQRGDSAAVSIAYNVMASLYNTLGIGDKAEYYQLKSIDYLDQITYPDDNSYLGYGNPPNIGLEGKINRKTVLAYYLINNGEYEKAIKHLHESIDICPRDSTGELMVEPTYMYLQMARAKVHLKADSVDYYFNLMRRTLGNTNINNTQDAHYFQEKSFGFYMADQLDSAEANVLQCINIIADGQLPLTSVMGTLTPGYYLALVRNKQNRTKEAIAALVPEITNLRLLNLRREVLAGLKLLAETYTLDGDYTNATKTYKEYSSLLNEMAEEERNNRSISFEIEKRMADNERAVQELQTKNEYNQKRQYYLLGILGLALLLAFGLLTRNRYKQKINKELIRKNKDIETALNQLKSTQAQLIQSEKMASLGELTAGIAHEIQNPLNFVNNFSEVSHELLDEMKQELATGNKQQAIDLAEDVKQNLEKITYHGKRADAIVKGMLQHSRASSGTKEPTDINALCDEYLRLAYHGLRAKDKTFNATIKTDFDPDIGLINIVPQDIGRVILNLITNAFYAVSEKAKNNIIGYEPTVTVKSMKLVPPLGGKGGLTILISITDNGPGIPDTIKDKIFQPFFTTKPTGQGTGLGLSLSYDIVKAHGGQLKVETREGEGTTFIIQLPVS